MTAQGFTDQGSTTSDNLLAGEFPRIAELATVSGGKYARGTILGKITASGKCTICTSAATDGSKDAYAVLAEAVDASEEDKQAIVYLTGEFNAAAHPRRASFGHRRMRKRNAFRRNILPLTNDGFGKNFLYLRELQRNTQ